MVPKLHMDDFIQQSLLDIVVLLTNPPPSTVPSLQAGNKICNVLLELTNILNQNPISEHTFNNIHRTITAATASLSSQQYQNKHQPSESYSHLSLKEVLARVTRVLKQKTPPLLKPLQFTPQTNPVSYNHCAAQALLVNHLFQPTIYHIYDDLRKDLKLKDLLTSKNKAVWTKVTSNELGRLTKENTHCVSSTDTMEFIHLHEIPTTGKVTYAKFVQR